MKARTVVWRGEECLLCDPGYELRKGSELEKTVQRLYIIIYTQL